MSVADLHSQNEQRHNGPSSNWETQEVSSGSKYASFSGKATTDSRRVGLWDILWQDSDDKVKQLVFEAATEV